MNLFIELPAKEKQRIEQESVDELNRILLNETPRAAQVVLDDVTVKFLNYIKRSKSSEYFQAQKHSEELKGAQKEIDRLTERIQHISNPNR